MALQEADDATRAQVIELVRPAFAPFIHGDEVRYARGVLAHHRKQRESVRVRRSGP